MPSHTITFHPNGTATTLWTDQLPLRELGQLKVQRASRIEFNNATQEWEVRFLPVVAGVSPAQPVQLPLQPIFSSPSHQTCLQWEHDQLNR